MVKNQAVFRAFEIHREKTDKTDFEQNLRILEALGEEALLLGALPPRDPLEGIELKIRLARAINHVQRSA